MPLRRRLALWLCPDLAPKPLPFDPSDLPVFHGKATPKWSRNAELRTFLTASHRKLTLEETRVLAFERFPGEFIPSKSALQRYWAELDAQRDPPTPAIPFDTISQEAS